MKSVLLVLMFSFGFAGLAFADDDRREVLEDALEPLSRGIGRALERSLDPLFGRYDDCPRRRCYRDCDDDCPPRGRRYRDCDDDDDDDCRPRRRRHRGRCCDDD